MKMNYHSVTHTSKDKDCVTMAEIVEIQQEVESFGMDWYDPTCHAIKILDAKYEKVQIDDVVALKCSAEGWNQTIIE